MVLHQHDNPTFSRFTNRPPPAAAIANTSNSVFHINRLVRFRPGSNASTRWYHNHHSRSFFASTTRQVNGRTVNIAFSLINTGLPWSAIPSMDGVASHLPPHHPIDPAPKSLYTALQPLKQTGMVGQGRRCGEIPFRGIITLSHALAMSFVQLRFDTGERYEYVWFGVSEWLGKAKLSDL